MKFTVDSVRLNQLLWNVILFANKTGVTKGLAYFVVNHNDNRIYAAACDDFIIVRDAAEIVANLSSSVEFTLSNADLKTLEKYSRDWKETVEITLDGDFLTVNDNQYPIGIPDTELWSSLSDLLARETPVTIPPSDFYLNPDRLKNIPRLKIEGDHPVGFRYLADPANEDAVMLGFIHGSSVRGVVTSMDEQILRERNVAMFDVEPASQAEDDRVWEAEGFVQECRTESEPEQEDEGPPWDIDEDNQDEVDPDGFIHDLQGVRAKDYLPENLTARVQYDTPISNEAPAHVDEGEFNEFGY